MGLIVSCMKSVEKDIFMDSFCEGEIRRPRGTNINSFLDALLENLSVKSFF